MADDEKIWEDSYKKHLGDFSPASLVSLRNNVSSAHFSAIANGAGLGFLPTYVQAMGGGLVPLGLEIRAARDIWLTYRADAKRIVRIDQTIHWITQVFNPRDFPWFRDDFIHPDRFADLYKGQPQNNTFGRLLMPR